MTHMRLIVFCITLITVVGCARKITGLSYGVNARFNATVKLLETENDTILVLSEGLGSKNVSFHTLLRTDSTLILKNIHSNFPRVTLVSMDPDPNFQFQFVDETFEKLDRVDARITINDSIQFDFNFSALELRLFHDLDTINSLKINFAGGFEFSGSNYSRGKFVFQVTNLNPHTLPNNWQHYYNDYTITTPLVDLRDTSTLLETTLLKNPQEAINYVFRSSFELKKRQFDKRYSWTDALNH